MNERKCRVIPGLGRIAVSISERGVCAVNLRSRERARAGRDADSRLMSECFHALARYARGKCSVFRLRLDLSTLPPFTRAVLAETRRIPFGKTVSYGELARRIGRPRAARAVGQSLGRNPVPILIPCHRVIAGDGTLGGFTGGLRIKRKLLSLEKEA